MTPAVRPTIRVRSASEWVGGPRKADTQTKHEVDTHQIAACRRTGFSDTLNRTNRTWAAYGLHGPPSGRHEAWAPRSSETRPQDVSRLVPVLPRWLGHWFQALEDLRPSGLTTPPLQESERSRSGQARMKRIPCPSARKNTGTCVAAAGEISERWPASPPIPRRRSWGSRLCDRGGSRRCTRRSTRDVSGSGRRSPSPCPGTPANRRGICRA